MTPADSSEQDARFKSKRTGLVVLGVVSITIGVMCGCLAIFLPFAMLAAQGAPEQGTPAPDARGIAFGLVFYMALAGLFIWTGIGSIRVRRWVRPIMLILAWTWLLCGVLGLAFWLVMLPDLPAAVQAAQPNAPPLSPEAYKAISLIASAFLFVVYIALPTVFVWFYQDKQVKATLEREDPVLRWTDRCPLPVLGLSLGLAFSAFACIGALIYGVFPLFGVMLRGAPATMAILLVAAALAFLARATYRLEWIGWWGTVAFTAVMLVSGIATSFRIDLFEIYRQFGLSAEQIDMMRQYKFLNSLTTSAVGAVTAIATLAYMVYLRRFFVPPPQPPGPEPGA